MAIAPVDTHPAACGWSLFGRSTVECLFHYQNNQPAVPQLCHISRNMLGQIGGSVNTPTQLSYLESQPRVISLCIECIVLHSRQLYSESIAS